MVRPLVREEDKVVETWKSAIAGEVWVWVYDRREDRYVKSACGGRHTKQLFITRDDRKYNQELIPVENKKHDPFTNGALVFVEAATRDENLDVRFHFTDEDLQQIFAIRDMDNFQEAIKALDSELILRRLHSIAQENGTVAQSEAVKEHLAERYPIGGTQKSIKDLFQAPSNETASFRM